MKHISWKMTTVLISLLVGSLCFFSNNTFAAEGMTNDEILNQLPSDRKLSFDFQNIDVRALLQLISKTSGLNFVISDAVKGNVTLKLKNVTWQQALNIILKSHGLASRQVGNVMYISTIEEISGNEVKEFQSEEQLTNLAPLVSQILCLKYTSARNVAELLKGSNSNLLTQRGQVAADSRTNCIIIRDIPKNLKDIDRAIRRVDVPAKQVSIEARIVNIDVVYEEQIGVEFGISNTRHLSGTLNAANQITGGTTPSSVTDPGTSTIDPAQRLNFNMPAAPLQTVGGTPGSIALALARLGPVLLDLELSALEGESHAKTIARPRVVTANQQKAVILTGQEIPYQEATSSGATNITFKNAVLSLEITPQITPNNKINLHIKATQDRRGDNITTGSNATAGSVQIPIIDTQAVESSILLNNNETVVIGGVYQTTKTNTIQRVPFFGSLPVLGYLFRHTGESEEKHELLIFVTPKIINSTNDINLAAAKGEYKD